MSTPKTLPPLTHNAFSVPISERLKVVVDGFERWRSVSATDQDLDEIRKCIAMAEVIEQDRAKSHALLQMCCDALRLIGRQSPHALDLCDILHHDDDMLHGPVHPCPGILRITAAITALKDHGITPSE